MTIEVLPAKCGKVCYDKPHILRDVPVLCTLKPGHIEWHYDGVANHRWPLDLRAYDKVDATPDPEPRTHGGTDGLAEDDGP